jgi:hypothetical protein
MASGRRGAPFARIRNKRISLLGADALGYLSLEDDATNRIIVGVRPCRFERFYPVCS